MMAVRVRLEKVREPADYTTTMFMTFLMVMTGFMTMIVAIFMGGVLTSGRKIAVLQVRIRRKVTLV